MAQFVRCWFRPGQALWKAAVPDSVVQRVCRGRELWTSHQGLHRPAVPHSLADSHLPLTHHAVTPKHTPASSFQHGWSPSKPLQPMSKRQDLAVSHNIWPSWVHVGLRQRKSDEFQRLATTTCTFDKLYICIRHSVLPNIFYLSVRSTPTSANSLWQGDLQKSIGKMS